MLGTISLSELQFHLRDENCKAYPTKITELPFYLCMKDGREVYDEYFENNVKSCPKTFAGLSQDYDHFCRLLKSIEEDGWSVAAGIVIKSNPRGRGWKLLKNQCASDGKKYLVCDGMHRCAILFHLYGDVTLGLKYKFSRKGGFYQPILKDE